MFKKAEKKKVWLKMAFTGPSGSGKTYSSLLMASALGSKVAVIDTENGSASLYADRFGFDVLELKPPYEVKQYADAIQASIASGYDVLVMDSISHAWAGEGGLLQKKEALDKSGRGNSYTNWASITKEQESFKSKILHADIHMICTMRSKQDYVLSQNDKGKQIVQKVGMAPIQREGMEYEFTTVFDLSIDHHATVSKDRTGLFDGRIFIPTLETGKQVMEWLKSGAGELTREVNNAASGDQHLSQPNGASAGKEGRSGVSTAAVQPKESPRTNGNGGEAQRQKALQELFHKAQENGLSNEEVGKICKQHFPLIKSRNDLAMDQIKFVNEYIDFQIGEAR